MRLAIIAVVLLLTGCAELRDKMEIDRALLNHEIAAMQFRRDYAKEIAEFESNMRHDQ